MKSLSLFLFTIIFIYCTMHTINYYRILCLVLLSLLIRRYTYILLIFILVLVIYNYIRGLSIFVYMFVGKRHSIGDVSVKKEFDEFYESFERLVVRIWEEIRKLLVKEK